ncbi:MAG: hypothetical protein NTW26_02945 [bacterium]|nr:hypothetical protein [bacterium]
MKKFLILAVVLLMMAPAAFGKNMVEGKFGAGLALGTGESLSMTDSGNQLGLGLVLQYGITGLTFQGYFDYDMALAPKTSDDITGEAQSVMEFGVNFLGTVGDGPFVGYAGLGFFYGMATHTPAEDADEMSQSTLGLNLTAAMDYFLNDMIALGFQVTYPISLSSTISVAGTDAEYGGGANAAGMGYKVDISFFF